MRNPNKRHLFLANIPIKYILGHEDFTLRQHYAEAVGFHSVKTLWFIPGEIDAQILTLLQSTFPAVPITADVVEGSSQLTDNFKGIDNSKPHSEMFCFIICWYI